MIEKVNIDLLGIYLSVSNFLMFQKDTGMTTCFFQISIHPLLLEATK